LVSAPKRRLLTRRDNCLCSMHPGIWAGNSPASGRKRPSRTRRRIDNCGANGILSL
jgi:hypothetical protein